jgi:hypothetical protein
MTTIALITTDNTVSVVDREVDLTYLQGVVGGYIEGVTLSLETRQVMIVNEEGKIKQLPVNAIATALYQHVMGIYDVIMGDVAVLGYDDEGENTDINKWAFDRITEAVEQTKAELQ